MPSQSKTLKVTVSGTGTVAGQDAYWLNRTTGERIKQTLASDRIALLDINQFPSGATAGDIIEFTVNGPAYGTATITLSGTASQSTTLAATEQTAPVATSM